jgi:peptidoglycan/LPS O-acetylase OafA/YrhL
MKKLVQLDNWRAILSCLVFISHGFQILSPNNLKNEFWMIIWGPLAHISVLLFFFISGYVIWNSLQNRSKIKTTTLEFTLNFTKARFFRIFPPLIGSVLLIYLLKYLIKIKLQNHMIDSFNFSKLDVFQYLCMFKVSLGKINAPLWSLIIEWWFYFLGLLIFNFSQQKNYILKVVVFIICFFILKEILISLNSDIVIYFVVWSIGAIVKKYELFEYKKITMIISLFLFVYLFIIENVFFSGIDLSKNPLFQFLITVCFIGFISLEFNLKILRFISNFSYSLYIIHYPIFLFVFYFINNMKINSSLTLILSLLFILILSYLFSKIFERDWIKTSTGIIKKWGLFQN